jgi:hypothetical protein
MNIQYSLHGAHLIGYTQLSLPGRCLQLSPITVTHLYFYWHVHHDISDHFSTVITSAHMINTIDSTKNPFPAIRSIDPVGCFVTEYHLALTNAFLDLFKPAQCPFSSSFHDLVDPALADLHMMQVEQCILCAGIAQMLFLSGVHHRCFKATSQ